SSKMGAELDSLSDAISFGVAPALVLYVWMPGDDRFGWVATLIFAVCMVLRLARFNTLLDEDQPAFAGEFFVGVPAPAGGLVALLPVMLTLQFGDGWWSAQLVVVLWTVATAALLISRIPTLSLKKLRAPAKAVAPLLVGVGLLAAAVIQYPLISLATALVLYLAHIPYSVRRYHWLAAHPEAWDVPGHERRAIRRGLRGVTSAWPRLRGRVTSRGTGVGQPTALGAAAAGSDSAGRGRAGGRMPHGGRCSARTSRTPPRTYPASTRPPIRRRPRRASGA